jgi:branched-chain amino acid transport system ATP-binding protein
MNDNSLLKLVNVTSGYGKKLVIRDVNISIGQGKIITLIGSNGVGKSTTLRAITGMLKLHSGRLSYRGQDITGLRSHKIASLGFGYSPEGRRVFGNLTVFENLVVGAYRIKSKQVFKRNLEWIYTLFPRLKERNKQLSESLSGGEQQMLAIGRALISKPELLLLDEPSLGLAPILVQQIADTLLQINQVGVSILLVEQNAKMALEISHYAYVMEKGGIVHEGDSKSLLKHRNITDIYLGFD